MDAKWVDRGAVIESARRSKWCELRQELSKLTPDGPALVLVFERRSQAAGATSTHYNFFRKQPLSARANTRLEEGLGWVVTFWVEAEECTKQ
jgi:hypothetical protein